MYGIVAVVYNSLWLWRWLTHRLSKRQSLSKATVLFRTMFTPTIKLNLLLKWLLGSNLSQTRYYSEKSGTKSASQCTCVGKVDPGGVGANLSWAGLGELSVRRDVNIAITSWSSFWCRNGYLWTKYMFVLNSPIKLLKRYLKGTQTGHMLNIIPFSTNKVYYPYLISIFYNSLHALSFPANWSK